MSPRAEATTDAELSNGSRRLLREETVVPGLAGHSGPGPSAVHDLPLNDTCPAFPRYVGTHMARQDDFGIQRQHGSRGYIGEGLRTRIAHIGHDPASTISPAAQCFLLDTPYLNAKTNGAVGALPRGDMVRFRRLQPAA